MRTFKLIDSIISATLIIIFISLAITDGYYMILYPYFIVGGWQIISMIIHEINNWFVPEGSLRRLYHHVVMWMIAGFIILILVSATIWQEIYLCIMIYLYFLLVFSPVMAIFYTALCFIEWKEARPKPMAKLNN